MEKLIFYGCIVLSACIGVVVGAHTSWGLAIFVGLQFALVGLALGGLFTFFWGELMDRKRGKAKHEHDEEWGPLATVVRDGSGTSPEEVAENFWRDGGHPPFTSPDHYDPRPTPEDDVAKQLLDRVNPSLSDPDGNDPHL